MSVYANEGKSGGSVYSQKGSSGGSVYSGKSGGGPPAKKKKKKGGLLHSVERYSGAELVGNLGKDIGETAVGIGPGLYSSGKAILSDVGRITSPSGAGRHSPLAGGKSETVKKVVKPTVEQYKQTYGPLVHGDIKAFGKGVYKHPLGPILDALTVADLGSTGAVRLGLLPEGRATIVTRSPRKIATGKGPVHTEVTSTKPIVRGRERVTAALRAKHPEGGITIGGRVIGRGKGGELTRYGKQIQREAGQHALEKLAPYQPYFKATHGLSHDEWQALHIRAMDIHPADLAELWKGTQAEKTATDANIVRLALSPSKKMLKAEPHARGLSDAGAAIMKRAGKLQDEVAGARPDLTKRQASEALGRPVKSITGEPYYFPHTMEPEKFVNPLKSVGGGKAKPRVPGTMKQNTGALALTGKLHLRTDVLGPEFLRRIKYVKYDEIHNGLRRGAVRATGQQIREQFGGKLPAGWEFLRIKPGQRIPLDIRGEGTKQVPLHELIPSAEDLHESALAKEGFTTEDIAKAHTSASGHYYIVPKHMAKAATGEFTRSSDFTHAFVKRPLMVWRAAVLGLRVGFLTNNLVGNSVMYAVKTGGTGALRDLFMSIMETHGAKVAQKALDNSATPPALRQDLYHEFFPEQIQGTFGRTQSPATSAAHVAGRKSVEIGRAVTGAIPRLTSSIAETGFRKALVRHSIRHSPEFKKAWRAMPVQTRSFEAAAKSVLEGKGGKQYQRFISKQVNQALGDYLNLSPFERNVIRNAVPFYSWYKAITTTTYHLAADTPLRANILGQIGQIGKQQSDAWLGDVPSFLRGSIPIGHARDGIQKVLGTQSLNPYATLEQLYSASTGDLSALGLNPFLQSALDIYARKTGRAGKIGPAQLAGEVLKQIILGLPPSRLAHPTPPSKLYPRRDRKSEGFGFLGVPIKEYNVRVARQQAKAGR